MQYGSESSVESPFVWLLALLFSSCSAPVRPIPPPPSIPVAPPPPPPVPPSRPLIEETLPSAEKPELVIVDLKESESEDQLTLFVEGTLRNHGVGQTKQVQVTVNALAEFGEVVASVEALPTPQVILPGGSATFVVRFPNDPMIRRFHVEAEFR
jgi:hypothetical protein